jgi:fatty acid synthase
LSTAELRAEIDRLVAHGDVSQVNETATWLAWRAAEHGRPEIAAELARVSAQPAVTWPALPLRGERPTVALDEGGVPVTGSKPDEARLLDLVREAPEALAAELAVSLKVSPDLRGETALVTGAAPGSIGAEVVKRLLRGGARVVVATSTDTPERRRFYRELYRTSAGPEAELHVVPANLASFGDIDALSAWLEHPGGGRRGRDDLRLDPLTPTILVPFAALSTTGNADEAGADFETAIRLQLLGVQRLIGNLKPPTVLLPLSPNHGAFGGDGPYGETKAALEVLLKRATSEPWGAHMTLIAPKIGWVRGTNLMAGNDAIAPLVEERLRLRTYSASEMAWLLTALLVTKHPGEVDLSGGMAQVADLRGALQPLADELREHSARTARTHALRSAIIPRPVEDALQALPNPGTDAAPHTPQSAPLHALDPADLVVIVGTGELGPGGTGRSRFALELGELDSPGVVAELAWLTGLVRYELERYRGRWIDTATKEEVREEDLAARYADEVARRIGVRQLESDGTIDADGHTVLAPVTLEQPITFEAASEEEARSYAGATVRREGDRILVTLSGQIRVPRIVAQTRRVAGQLPTGLDLARYGVPTDLIATADRMALINLAATVDAFQDAGLTPEELLEHVHPADVANTQGAGMGGMASLRRLLLDHLLDAERQNDRVQESLGNVVAAHAVQTYLGSYGPMIHPVGACATAAVSLEVAYDKITSGKALAVLTGGFDDLTPEGMIGFADMGATASSEDLEAMGLAPHEASRANDTRRAGFVEAQGGGAQLVTRGDVALALGLPVRGVLAYAGSFADGLHTSIPAAGLGALAAARPLRHALRRHGLTADDIGVVSKHDTSTDMNDPNEADLHDRLQTKLDRTAGNPLLVVSQKTVTGHAKGGAAAWQLDGVLRMLETGKVPGNRNLESVDPLLRENRHLALGDRTITLAEPLKAALIASLGFGHVSAILAVAHADTFHAAIPEEARDDYLRRAGRRRAEGVLRRLQMRVGKTPTVRRPRTLDRDAEATLLLDR